MSAHEFRFKGLTPEGRRYSPPIAARAGELAVEVAVLEIEKPYEVKMEVQESQDRVNWEQVGEFFAGGAGWFSFRSALARGPWVRVACWTESGDRWEARVTLHAAEPGIVPPEEK